MVTKAELAEESADLTSQVQALAALWRKRAYDVQADLRGHMKGSRYHRPKGMEAARMAVQVQTLLGCAAALENLLD